MLAAFPIYLGVWVCSVAFTASASSPTEATFQLSACERNEQRPYRRQWLGNPSSELPYKVPEHSEPMLCESHSPYAPFLLVVANGRNESRTHWLKELRGVPYEVYHQDSTSDHTHDGIGLEATVYMKFIAQHYDCLPEVVGFVHSHVEQTWHRYEPLNHSLRKIQWSKIKGFALLHRRGRFLEIEVTSPEKNIHGKEVPMPFKEGQDGLDCGNVVNGTLYHWWDLQLYHQGLWTLKLWDLFLGRAGLGPVPEKIVMHEGAEFLIHRDRILARPRQFYLDALSFMQSAAKDGIMTGFEAAVAFEYIFHVIFGEAPMMSVLPTPECVVYRCDSASERGRKLISRYDIQHHRGWGTS